MSFLSQTSNTGIDPFITLAQYGIIGLILILTAKGFIWWKPAIDRLFSQLAKAEEKLEKVEAKLDAKQDIYEKVVLPTLKETGDVAKDMLDWLWEARRNGAA